jgi:solute carrier family 25 iron transporter 28/37
MEHVSLFPIDTVKTHMQSSGSSLSMVRTAKILAREEGLLRFWKGANVVASGCVPAHATQFCSYELLKAHFEMKNERFNISTNAAIGAFTVIAHDFFITPSDIVK